MILRHGRDYRCTIYNILQLMSQQRQSFTDSNLARHVMAAFNARDWIGLVIGYLNIFLFLDIWNFSRYTDRDDFALH